MCSPGKDSRSIACGMTDAKRGQRFNEGAKSGLVLERWWEGQGLMEVAP